MKAYIISNIDIHLWKKLLKLTLLLPCKRSRVGKKFRNMILVKHHKVKIKIKMCYFVKVF